MFFLLACAAVLSCLSDRARAQGDGARTYQLAPADTHLFTAFGIFDRSNQTTEDGIVFRGQTFDLNQAILRYAHPISIDGSAANVFALLPIGAVSGAIHEDGLVLQGRTSSGIGDITIGGWFGLIGLPSLSPKEYATYKPGFSLAFLPKITAPTGDYSSGRIVNLGANRWAFKLGFPIAYAFGETPLDPELTTFEILPSVAFFTANYDPFDANKVQQAPLYTVEAHITRNLNRVFWISGDGFYTYGGATTVDGIDNRNPEVSLGLGGTLGVTVSGNFFLKFTYGQIVARNSNGLDGRAIRLVAATAF
ncbi:MAG TPA: transporter [Micropepsaceae bacterium]|nr:transporter [Micropepsaceae bacterium]